MPRPKKNRVKDLEPEALIELINNMMTAEIPMSAIARVVGVSETDLRNDYVQRLEGEQHKRNAAVVKKLYELCLKGDRQAIMFWCKAKLGWKEKSEVEVSGGLSNMQPVLNVTVSQISERDFKKLSDPTPDKYIALPETECSPTVKGD
jgi:hypothetical protein